MDLQYSESERLLKDGARAFLQKEIPAERIGEVEASGALPRDLWKQIGAQGWFGVGVDEARGGGGGTLVEWAIVLEELGYAGTPAPVAEQLAASVYLASLSGAPAGVPAVPDVTAGTHIVSVGVENAPTEPAQLLGDRLTGRKTLIPYGASADSLLLFVGARASERYVMTARDQPGVSLRVLATLSADQHVEARFADTPAAALGVSEPNPWDDLREIYAIARDAYAVGLLLRMLDMSVSYAKDRVQFGRPIGSFQAIQYRCVDIALSAYGAQALLYQGAWNVQSRRPAPLELGMLHSYTRDACDVVVRNAHQTHGAIGFTQEYPLQYFTRRAKAHQQSLGSAAQHRETAAAAMAAAAH